MITEAEKVEIEEAARLSKTSELSMGAKDLFNLKNVKTCAQTLFKKREHHTRALMLFLILAYELDYFVLKGHWSTSYMFVRKTLKFTMTDYSRFITIAGIMGLLGQYVVLPYMSTKLLWKDSVIGMIGIFLKWSLRSKLVTAQITVNVFVHYFRVYHKCDQLIVLWPCSG